MKKDNKEWYTDLLDRAKDLAKKKEAKDALKKLKAHQEIMEEMGREGLMVALGKLGLEMEDEARDYLAIMAQSPQELISGVSASASEIREAHKQAIMKAIAQRAAIKDLLGDVGRIALSLVVAAL